MPLSLGILPWWKWLLAGMVMFLAAIAAFWKAEDSHWDDVEAVVDEVIKRRGTEPYSTRTQAFMAFGHSAVRGGIWYHLLGRLLRIGAVALSMIGFIQLVRRVWHG